MNHARLPTKYIQDSRETFAKCNHFMEKLISNNGYIITMFLPREEMFSSVG